jgi:hypothetical protein
MYISDINGLLIKSDYEIRPVREDEIDIDHFIEFNYRVINIIFDKDCGPLSNLQLTKSYGLLIRQSKIGKKMASLHFLNSIDINQAYLNFDLDYSEFYLEIKNESHCTQLLILRRKDV